MKKIYILLFLPGLFMVCAQNSQLYHAGTFLNKENKSQNFLKVYNKTSGVYELTDEKGFAIIAAKAYDTLVWNNGNSREIVYYPAELKSILESKIPKERVLSIHSSAYDSLVSKKSEDEYSLENSRQRLTVHSDQYIFKVRKLKQVSENNFKLRKLPEKYLFLNGSFTTSFDIKSRNAIPRIQKQYVQGRSYNGQPVWRGPETDEMFSFGPDISTLAFDHQPYPYDQNGMLVPAISENPPATAYNNELFKTTVGYSNQLRLNAFIKNENDEKIRISLDLGQQKNQMYFADQYNVVNTLKTKFNTKILKFDFNFAAVYEENKATNSNRAALFNRAYQNSLLTPVSFSNKQRLLLPDGAQRSYSRGADNPEFLLDQENKYNYQDRRRQFSFDLKRQWGQFNLNSSQSFENDYFRNFDQYHASTHGFADGIQDERLQNNRLYYSNISGSYSFDGYHADHLLSLNYILNNERSQVFYSLTNKTYLYQRLTQDYIINYKVDYTDHNDFFMGFNAGNAFYISNTSLRNNYWLPKAGAYITFNNIFGWYNINLKMLGTYTRLSTEPEITKSYASYGTTLLKAQNAYQYFPVQEAERFKNLSTVNTEEWKGGFKLTYRNLAFEAEYFKRKITDDIFPVFEGNQLLLKNLADHTYAGYDVSFSYDHIYLGTDFRTSQKASFYSYQDKVNRVSPGYNGLALAGFTDIYKTLREGEALGVVVGSYFKRNADGALLIDESGYPEKADGLKVIADPTPDFVVKFKHSLSYKMFSLDLNWEWKKGGQIWNGTQAVLDYYGRSSTSGDERNIRNYVFQGVNSNGMVNQIPVDFYDPDQPVSKNRWSRYGYLGVAEDYVQNADYIRINTVSLTAKFDVGAFKRALGVTFFVNNILLWQAAKGADPNQNFYDAENGRGLDFFNLPSYKTFGCMVSFQF